MAVDKLVDSAQLDSDLNDIADAILAKSGGTGPIAFPSGFLSEIADIPSGGGGGNPKLVLQYTLAEDFATQATTDLATITSNDIQTFFDTHFGVRGSFPSGSAKHLRIDVKSNVTPASDYSYITHFWYESFVGFGAGSQVGFTPNNVVVRNGFAGFTSQAPLYTLRPEISNISGGSWVVTVKARCTGNAQFSVWKAGTYTFTIEYLGDIAND